MNNNSTASEKTGVSYDRRALIIVLGVGLLWLLMGAGDWYMRFHWFKWHQSFRLHQAAVQFGPYEPMRVMPKPPSQGGDISQLLGIPSLAARYMQDKPAATNRTDEFGFLNEPPTRDTYYPIVVVGDSYMASGATPADRFSEKLAAISGLPVYNHAYIGRGSFWGILRFLVSDHFKDREPKVVIWGIIEREISGNYFVSALSQMDYLKQKKPDTPAPPRWDFHVLEPSRLKSSLPNSSAMAQLSARIWNKTRYYVLGEINRMVVPAVNQIGGRNMLFYFPGVDAMKWSEQVRDVPNVTRVIEEMSLLCRQKNVQLVMVLIPDKEQVYREHLPPSYLPVPPSVLYPLESALREKGIPVVNLLDPFRAEAEKDRLLYWPDDTHWNPEGIEQAAKLTWPVIRPMMDGADASSR